MKYWLAVATLAAAGASVAACGGGSSHAGAAATPTSGSDKAVRYSQCMREHGIKDFPDPVNGRLMLKAGPGSDMDPSSSAFKTAQTACQAFAPPSSQGGGASAQGQSDSLNFAKCMRSHGVPKFPDPVNGRFMFQKGSGVAPDSGQFKSAQTACQKYMTGGS